MENYINYRGILVPFSNLKQGGIDNAIKYGIYPLEEDITLNKLFRPRDVVYDIGSYIGSHSILFALQGAEVFAFEPSPFNYHRCVENCKNFRQIHVLDYALHEKEYEVETLFKDCNNQDGIDKMQKIKYKILSNIIKEKNLPLPNFIKMDIEGMETLVLKTMDDIFLNCRPILFIELHKKSIEDKTQDYENNPHWRDVSQGGFDFNTLKKYNYKFIWRDGKENFIDKNEELNWNDEIGPSVILIPKEKIK